MVVLNYQTNNPRWGWSGIEYSSWENYAFCLGYLSNIDHYKNKNNIGLIDLHVEGNYIQGAWGREGRIHYYGNMTFLKNNFPDWYENSSAGNAATTCRVNSNDYVYSLVFDYGFEDISYRGRTTHDIFPPRGDAYNLVLNQMLEKIPIDVTNHDDLIDAFSDGWNLR